MKFMRIVAQIIDWLFGLSMLMVSFLGVRPVLSHVIKNDTVLAVIVLIIFILLTFGVQYLFLRVGQTLGKGFLGLQIVNKDDGKPPKLQVMLIRELGCKLMSCYFICIPMLKGEDGGHEQITNTEVVKYQKANVNI